MQVYRSDAAEALEAIAAERGEFAHGAILSPPYFQKFEYHAGPGEIGLEETVEGYLDSLVPILELLYRVTVPGGAMMLNVGETWNNVSLIRSHLRQTKERSKRRPTPNRRRKLQPERREKAALTVPLLVAEVAQECGWSLRDTIAWVKMGGGRPTKSDRPASAWEPIFYFRKPDREAGRPYHAYWDGKTLPSNVVTVAPDGDPVHPCPFPTELVWRLLLAVIPPNGWTIDPFGGTGTVAVTALEQERRAVTIDLSEQFTAIAVNRIEDYYRRPRQIPLFPL